MFLQSIYSALVHSLVLLFVGAVCAQSPNTDLTIKVSHNSKAYIGKPMTWDGKEMLLLRRDGRVSTLPVRSRKDFSKIKDGFKPYSKDELRVRLQKEFGSKYQVSITENFVVVHPHGSYNVWAMPFQKLYAQFHAYFFKRGFKLTDPEFPMVAVVLKSRKDFDRFLRKYHDYDSRVLGYYSPNSNRIITYDQTGGSKSKSSDWLFNAHTIIHEATHQTAFNTGIHSRYAPVPRWISEGLAMMFEAPGVNNSLYHAQLSDRINRDRLIVLKSYYAADQVRNKLADLVVSDQIFRTDPELAYALSWGLTFYLSEKMPSQYQAFLKADGERTDFQGFDSKRRAAAFLKSFGGDLQALNARMKRYFEALSVPRRK